MNKKRPTAKIDTSAIEGILNVMADKLQHMHDRLNYLSATLDAFDPQAVKDQIGNFAHLTQGKLYKQVGEDLRTISWRIDLLGRRIAKPRSRNRIKHDERAKAAKKVARVKK